MARLPFRGFGGGDGGDGGTDSSAASSDGDDGDGTATDRDAGGGGGGGGGGGSSAGRDRMRETVERFKAAVREVSSSPAEGMDAGEPIAGVDGPGDPRTAPDDPQGVEGPSSDGSSVDGLGGSGGGSSPTDQLRDLQGSPTSGGGPVGGGQPADDPIGGGGTSGLDAERSGGDTGGGDPTATLRDRQGAPTSGGSPLGDGTAREAGDSLGGDGPSEAAVSDQEILSGAVGDQARELEQQVLEETALEDADQVRIVREGDTLRAEVTDAGRDFLGRQQRAAILPAARAAADLADVESGMRTDEQEVAREQAVMGVRGASGAVEQDPGRTRSALFAALSQDQQMEANEDVIGQISRQQSEFQSERRAADREEFGDRTLFRVRELGGRSAEELVEDAVGFVRGGADDIAEEVPTTFITPAGPIELGEDNLARRAQQSSVRTVGDLVTLVPSAALGVKEAAEFVEAGGRETLAGDFEGFVSRAQRAGVERGEAFVEQARDNPIDVGVRGAGTAALSFGAIGAARAVGGARAARATSAAIQPGEELAIGLARRGIVPDRAARAVPGVRQGHIGDVDGTGVSLPGAGISRTLAETAARRPRARFETDADAGLIDAGPLLRDLQTRQVDLRPSTPDVGAPVRRARRGASAAADTLRGAEVDLDLAVRRGRRVARERSRAGRDRLLEAPSAASETIRRLPQQAEDVGFRAGFRTGARLDDLETDVRFTAGEARARAAELPQRAENVGFQAGVRTAERLADVDFPSFSRPSADVTGIGQRVRGLPQAVEDVGYRAGFRTGARLSDLTTDVRFTAGEARATVAALPQQAEDVGFRAGFRTGRRLDAFEADTVVSVGEALGGLRSPSFDLGRPSLPSLDGDRFSLGVRSRAGELARAAAETRDLTIRIGPGRPGRRRREIDADQLEFVGGDTPDDLGELFEGAAFDFDPVEAARRDPDIDVPQRGGRGPGQIAVTRRETDRTGTGTDPITERTFGLESAVGGVGTGLENIDVAQPSVDVGEAGGLTFDVGAGTTADVASGVGLEVGTDIGVGLDQRTDLELSQELTTEVDVAQDPRVEVSQEVRQEVGYEVGLEPNPEGEPFGFDFGIGAEGQASGFGATASERDFINRIGTVSDIIGI